MWRLPAVSHYGCRFSLTLCFSLKRGRARWVIFLSIIYFTSGINFPERVTSLQYIVCLACVRARWTQCVLVCNSSLWRHQRAKENTGAQRISSQVLWVLFNLSWSVELLKLFHFSFCLIFHVFLKGKPVKKAAWKCCGSENIKTKWKVERCIVEMYSGCLV